MKALLNLSAEPVGKLYSWLPPALSAETVVFFPDACPGKSPLPTGTAVLTRQADWRKLAVSDCGCGMRLLRSSTDADGLTPSRWDAVADLLRKNKGGLGDLGGGNHFLDAIVPVGGGPLHFLVHTGSRSESNLVDGLVDRPDAFDAEFRRIVKWAEDNRAAVQGAVEAVFGKTEVVLDLPHNTFEPAGNGNVLIRKGAVRLMPGELCVIPSHMTGDVLLARATDRIRESLCSMSHGTGRTMPRGESKEGMTPERIREIRARVMIPAGVEDSSLRTEGPHAYRDLDECLMLVDGFVEPLTRYSVRAYMGHL